MEKKLTSKLSSLSVVFPAFNDAESLPSIMAKIIKLLPKLADRYEIIIVNDGSKDDTVKVLEHLKRSIPFLRVIHHPQNLGYGAALSDGFKNAQNDYIFYTDSDGQYDVQDLEKLVSVFDGKTDIATGFKLKRLDPWYRKVIGNFYNQFVKFFFRLKVKDVDCDFRLFRRALINEIDFQIKSGAFDVEFIRRLQEKGARFKEVGVYHYPRIYGQSQFFNFSRITKSLWDLVRFRFSTV